MQVCLRDIRQRVCVLYAWMLSCMQELFLSMNVYACAHAKCVCVCVACQIIVPLPFWCGESWEKERPLDPKSEPQLAEGDKTNRLPIGTQLNRSRRRRRWVERRTRGRCSAEKCHSFIRFRQGCRPCVCVCVRHNFCMYAWRWACVWNHTFTLGHSPAPIIRLLSHPSITFFFFFSLKVQCSKCSTLTGSEWHRDNNREKKMARKRLPCARLTPTESGPLCSGLKLHSLHSFHTTSSWMLIKALMDVQLHNRVDGEFKMRVFPGWHRWARGRGCEK